MKFPNKTRADQPNHDFQGQGLGEETRLINCWCVFSFDFYAIWKNDP